MTDPTEAARQRALDATRLLDSVPEVAFDAIVRLASHVCDVPIALVTLVDRDRQWFKARVGLDAQETARQVAFCDHAIRVPEAILEVPDAALDPRFAKNPLVLAAPSVRFYAGVPIVLTTGEALGTVCVIDQRPRTLTPEQRRALGDLGQLTVALIEARSRERFTHRTPAPVTVPSGGFAVGIVQLRGAPRPVAEATKRLARVAQHVTKWLHEGEVVTQHDADEIVVVLAAANAEKRFERLRTEMQALGIDTVVAVSLATSASDAIEDVFLRAATGLARAHGARAVVIS